ncbi:MAG: septal ring-binding cell division protein DamX, partial [Gammaproteobacteria bacterium]
MSELIVPASIRFFLVGLSLCLCLNALAQSPADTFAQGREAYVAKDYKTAMRVWATLAETGDKAAQFALATLYQEGAGVERDPEQATHWFALAAEQGYPPAQFNLGNAFRRGDGVVQSDALASEWWKRAADQEFPPAQYNLATQYYFGRGVTKDSAIALIYYRRAAENGHAGAAKALARIEAQERASSGRPGAASSVETPSPTPISRTNDASISTSSPQATSVSKPVSPRVAASPVETASPTPLSLPKDASISASPPPVNPVSKPVTDSGESLALEAASPRLTARLNGTSAGTSTPKANPVSKRVTAPSPSPGTAPAASVGPSIAWIREQSPNWFTVQLLSLGSALSAQAFIDKRTWRHPVGYLEVVRSGKSYFSVVYGSFETKALAQAAAQGLPA